jgi:hypothetical protein
MASETYEYLKNLANGQELNRWSQPDYLIYDIHHKRGSNTIKVVITFDKDDDFLEVLGIEDENDKYYWGKYTSYHYDNDWDIYNYQEEWSDGHLISNFNESNIELVNEILKYTNPRLRFGNPDDTDSLAEISNFLKSRFKSEIENLIYDYAEEQEECRYRGARQKIVKETDKPFNKFGVMQKSHAYKFETNVNILLKLYRILNAEDEDIKGLLKKLYETYPPNDGIGRWEDYSYEAWCDDYDEDLVQKNFKKHLEKILDEIRENLDEYDSEEYNKLYDAVVKLGGFGKWINIPEKKISVTFNSLDDKTNKLTLTVHIPMGPTQKRVVDNLEDLNLTLYHPELFESVKKILKKLL